MISVSSEWFEGIGAYRGVMRKGNEYRYTRKQFQAGEEAELYALAVMLRFRTITLQGGAEG